MIIVVEEKLVIMYPFTGTEIMSVYEVSSLFQILLIACDTYPRLPQTRVLYLSPSDFLSPSPYRLLSLDFYQYDRLTETEKSY